VGAQGQREAETSRERNRCRQSGLSSGGGHLVSFSILLKLLDFLFFFPDFQRAFSLYSATNDAGKWRSPLGHPISPSKPRRNKDSDPLTKDCPARSLLPHRATFGKVVYPSGSSFLGKSCPLGDRTQRSASPPVSAVIKQATAETAAKVRELECIGINTLLEFGSQPCIVISRSFGQSIDQLQGSIAGRALQVIDADLRGTMGHFGH